MAPRSVRPVLLCGLAVFAHGVAPPPTSMPLRAADFTKYPGYAGTLTVSGTVMIGQENENAQVIFYELSGTDETCTQSYDAPNACGVHVHVGTTCDEAGGHHWNDATVTVDPWKTVSYRTVAGKATAQMVRIVTGLQLSGVVDRTIVIHDATGARVACAVLRPEVAVSGEGLTSTAFQPYPQYAGVLSVKGKVAIKQVGDGATVGQAVAFSLEGGDPECGTKNVTGVANACGIHVHAGTSCEVASEVGGHYYYNDKASARPDPWLLIQYAVAPAGTAAGVTIFVDTGIANKNVEGRAFVVHDSTGARVSCAIIEKPEVKERALAAAAEIEAHEGNPCKGKPDGWRCDDDVVIECSGGRTVSNESCPSYQGCKENRRGWGSASCEEDACEDKADGFHCKDDHVVECSGLRTVNLTKCAWHQECERDSVHSGVAACVEDECDRKADGTYCKGDHVIECRGQRALSATKCGITQECKKNALGWNKAACVEDDCHGKPDGAYCKHDGVVECVGQVSVGFSKCAFYQECVTSWQAGVRAAGCQEDACEDKADGWHCKGDHMVQCSGLATADFKICPMYTECEESWNAAAACA